MDSVTESASEVASASVLDRAIRVDADQVRRHVDEVVRGTVKQTLNALLDAEADALCGARRYERSPDRRDTRAGSYGRKLQTKAGEVTLKVPRLRKLPLETASSVTGVVRAALRRRWWRCTWRACRCAGWRTLPRRCGARGPAPAR